MIKRRNILIFILLILSLSLFVNSGVDIYQSNPIASTELVFVNTYDNITNDFPVARTNYTLYCNSSGVSSITKYGWYNNGVDLDVDSNILSSTNFVKGDNIFCKINSLFSSQNRYLIDSTLDDFDKGIFATNGTLEKLNLTRQSGNLTLNNISISNGYFSKGNFTSDIFRLGKNPNITEISFGYDIPHETYFYQDDLMFGWDGSQDDSYTNTSITGTCPGGLLTGNIDVNGTGYHVIDDNATFFNGSTRLEFDSSIDVFDDLTGGSISVWIKYSIDSTSDVSIFSSSDSGDFISVLTMANINSVDKISLFIREGAGTLLNARFPSHYRDNQWHNLVVTMNDTGSMFYVDGLNVTPDYAVGTSSTSAWFNDVNDLDTFRIANTKDSDGDNNYWIGGIDEFHIWNRTLTSDEVSKMYNQSQKGNLILRTKEFNYYDEGDEEVLFGIHGDSVTDYISGQVGTPTSGISIGEGYIGKGAKFNGINGYLDGYQIDFDNKSSYTITGWAYVYPSVLSLGNGVFGNGGSNKNFWLFDDANQVKFRSQAFLYSTFLTSSDYYEKWIQFSFVANGTGDKSSMSFYLNGDLVSSVNTDTTFSFQEIGRSRNQATDYYNGTLDEIHVFNRSLSSHEIQLIYNNSVESYNQNWSDYYSPNGTISPVINLTEPYRYLQYFTEIETLDGNRTPILTDVAIRQSDYTIKIFNTEPYNNFSLLSPENASIETTTNPLLNLTNISDLDGINTLNMDVEIYNSTILNSTYLVQYISNVTTAYTLTTALEADITYYWRARLNDSIYDDIYENYLTDWSGVYQFDIVGDSTPPNVTLLNPNDGSSQTEGAVSYQFNVTDNSTIENCTLNLNGLNVSTSTSIIANVSNTISHGTGEGTYTWKVYCADALNNIGVSGSRTITLTKAGGGQSGGGTPGGIQEIFLERINTSIPEEWEKGEITEINMEFRDNNGDLIDPISISYEFTPNPELFEINITTQISIGEYNAKFITKEEAIGNYNITITAIKDETRSFEGKFIVEEKGIIEDIKEQAEALVGDIKDITTNTTDKIQESDIYKAWLDLPLLAKWGVVLFILALMVIIFTKLISREKVIKKR